MVAMPCALALSRTALPVPESRLTMTRTLTPLVISWSAMVWKAFLSPWAFWMSYLTPAALNASSRYLRSAVSQRADVLLSGRMTPMYGALAPPELPPLGVLDLPHAARLPSVRTPAVATARIPLRMHGSFQVMRRTGRRGGSWYTDWPVVAWLVCRATDSSH